MKRISPFTTVFSLLAGALSLSACTGTSILNALNRADQYRTYTDLSYGPESRHTLDIYQPLNTQRSGCIVLFVYGGGWTSGSKEQYGFVGAQLAKRGHTVIIPDYRLFPEVTHPDFIHDIALATASDIVAQHRQDRPLVMMGHSAGAMIAGLISYDNRYLKAQGLDTTIINGYISLAGPHDYFLPSEKPHWRDIFGDTPKQQRTALTAEHITSDSPSTLILHGEDDYTVVPKSASSLERKLTAANVEVSKKLYQGVGHVRIVAAMGWPLHFLAPTLNDVEHKLNQHCAESANQST
ncbi:alpha/beta hydrolase [Gilvimarinus sp. 1_MG-2023]|uniref:alpha/beta hydrolase n=1 Tax=Gilvimarinus sp. 1_MG-2023 TaxID=3062638 RepID=UPI0026E2BEFC|nr:alpha/beta hydrolase [Gilvimarinus sp. 1_MG-2023]MDO6748295.1 alpha/beta hydrolase [Gilvimarinus sp. 1_MG-2023]